jgi:hypothetical protein
LDDAGGGVAGVEFFVRVIDGDLAEGEVGGGGDFGGYGAFFGDEDIGHIDGVLSFKN